MNLIIGTKYKLTFQCAAKENKTLATSGFRFLWNDVVVIDESVPTDYEIHSYSLEILANQTTNKMTFEARGTVDSSGTTCDNIFFNPILTDNNRIDINGTCPCEVGFFEQPPAAQCLACSTVDPLCLVCSNTTNVTSQYQFQCSKCIWGFYINSSACVPCTLALSLCANCSMDGLTCYACATTPNLSLVNGTCQCDLGYGQNLGTCSPCTFEPKCLKCRFDSNGNTCELCQPAYYASSLQCISCNFVHTACLNCSAAGLCFECQLIGNWVLQNNTCTCTIGFYQNSTTQCAECSFLDPLCLLCTSALGIPACLDCVVGYYPINDTCAPCNLSISGCTQCQTSGNVCYACDTGDFWQLFNGTCICQQGYYLNSTSQTCLPCSNLDVQCTLCISNSTSSTCLECSWGFYPVGTQCTPCTTSLIQCVNCTMDGLTCLNCNESADYYLDSYNTSIAVFQVCTPCSLPQCLDCSSLWSCVLCNEAGNFYVNLTTELCEVCTLEGCLNCSTLYSCFQCNRDLNYLLNDVTSHCHVCTLEGCIRCSSNETCQLCGPGYRPQPNSQFLCDPILGCSDLMDTLSPSTVNPAVPAVEYSLEQCQTVEKYSKLIESIGYTSYAVMFLSLFSGKIVGLELFGVLQLAYFNVGVQQFVNLYLSPFLSWRHMNGFNFQPQPMTETKSQSKPKLGSSHIQGTSIIATSPNVVPASIRAIGYSHSFIENMNVMLIILVAQFILSLLVLTIGSKIMRLKRIGFVLLKEVFVTLLIFNCFNISFSAALHFKYSTSQNTDNYVLSTVSAILAVIFCLLSLIGLQCLNSSQYGQFKNKFKSNFVTRAYITISILYRMALGIYMGAGNEQIYQSLLILAISLAYVMYNIINLPFQKAYHNYRANFCHCTQLVILIVSNFYSTMKANQPIQLKSTIFTPAQLQIFMMLLCLIISSVCLFYELYIFLRKKCKTNKIMTDEEKQAQKSRGQLFKTEANEQLYEENDQLPNTVNFNK